MCKRGNVTISYLDGCTFLICVLYCMFFSLGLVSYTEDCYTFMLGPHSFSLSPVPEGKPCSCTSLRILSGVVSLYPCLPDPDGQPHSSR